MDKTVTFAVAGAGKTSSIVDKLDLDRRILVVAYTVNTQQDLTRRALNKFGYMPSNLTIETYFTFLNRFCYRPLLFATVRDRGLCFDPPSTLSTRVPASDLRRYMDASRRLYHCRMAKLLDAFGRMPDLLRRLERYYDQIFVDEVQDFAGHDFNLLMRLSGTNVSWSLVGDFYQYTYATSRDGNVNKSLHDDFIKYQKRFVDHGFHVNMQALNRSHRCSENVCSFIRTHLGVDIKSASQRAGDVVIVKDEAQAFDLQMDATTLKLFLKEHELYECHSMTWGNSKGSDHYEDVCVVFNKETWRRFENATLRQSARITLNKLYVACSRPRRHLYIAPEHFFKRATAKRPRARAAGGF